MDAPKITSPCRVHVVERSRRCPECVTFGEYAETTWSCMFLPETTNVYITCVSQAQEVPSIEQSACSTSKGDMDGWMNGWMGRCH